MKRILSFPKLLLVTIGILTLSWIPSNTVELVDLADKHDQVKEKNEVLSPLILLESHARAIYDSIQLKNDDLSFEVFEKAFVGFLNLKDSHQIPDNSYTLSIADFDQSSKRKRLWIIDLKNQHLLLNTWVSHGRGSGGEIATKFSNVSNSHQSSLGFYVTGEVYNGKHGRSLRLDGMDYGFNNKARERAIVLHGASYVSSATIKSLNRLGLSHGCPAVPVELTNQIIDLIKDKTVLYLHASSPDYRSAYLNAETAGRHLISANNLVETSQVGI